jgi:hypothetical protein
MTKGIDRKRNEAAVTSGAEAAAKLVSKGYKVTRDLVLADGDVFEGTMVGPDKSRPFVDDKTGEVREVPAFLLDGVDGVRYRILAGSKLARLLEPVEAGAELAIQRLGMVETRAGRRMTDYAVGVRE